MINAMQPWNETVPSSDIRLTKKARAMRWTKTTIENGCRVSVSFHVSEWDAYTRDFCANYTPAMLPAGRMTRFTDGRRVIELTPANAA